MNLAALPPVDGAQAVVTAIADTNDESLDRCLGLIEELQSCHVRNVRVFRGRNAAQDLFSANVCDVCIIATPNFNHISIFEAIAKYAVSTMHVLCEKPLCTTLDDCRRVLKINENRKGFILVGLEYSYMSVSHRSLISSLPWCSTLVVRYCWGADKFATYPSPLFELPLFLYRPPIARVIRDTRADVVGRPQMVAIREHRCVYSIHPTKSMLNTEIVA